MSDLSLNPVHLSARAAIVAPERAIPVSLYATQKWLPRLGPERWCLVMLLRALCVDAPRRSDGTKQVVCSLQELAAALDIHKRTLLRWFKHEPIPNDSPWRRLTPTDEKAKFLALFIPRLRYAYETQNGKGKRVGLVIEVLMEDPVVPEDEIRVKRHVELIQMQQGQISLDTYRPAPESNDNLPPHSVAPTDLTWQNDTSRDHANGQSVTSVDGLNRQPDTSADFVKRHPATPHDLVNGQNVPSDYPTGQIDTSPANVTGQSDTLQPHLRGQNISSADYLKGQNDTSLTSQRQTVTSPDSLNRQFDTTDDSLNRQPDPLPPPNLGQSDTSHNLNGQSVILDGGLNGQNDASPITVNVNQLISLFKTIITQNVNPTPKLFEPIVDLTEQLLEDTHSTGMLYKVLKALHPHNFEIFLEAVETSLQQAEINPKINKGAFFVKKLRALADSADIDLGFKSKNSPKNSTPKPAPIQPQTPMPLPADPQPVSVEQAVWQEAQNLLRQQMPQATYNSTIRGTQLLSWRDTHCVVGVQSPAARTWLANRLADVVRQTLGEVVGQPVTVEFKLINGTK